MELHLGDVTLRPIRVRDQRAWQEANRRNRDWLRRWEATVPPAQPGRMSGSRPTYRQMVRYLRGEAAAGRILPFVVLYRGELVGQLTVGSITWGSMCSANVGYWIDEAVAGRGIMPTAVALSVDYCFAVLGLHRIEVCIRPENGPSRRVVEKLGFRSEGMRPRYLHIDGDWRDHLVYALTAEEVPEGLLNRWRAVSSRGRCGN
ncbi:MULTISPECIES: GNAT family N-acetyltransferase [Kitasatospora]|uniref:GNAT family protein n=1 Tax=Kitasatospora cystarginea TaxID=58350 RepID=A0ABP5RSK3_9ACTN